MLDIATLKYREGPVKYTKVSEANNKSNVVNFEKVKLYDYYICDYCNDQIKLDKKQHERDGGIATFPHSLTKCGELRLALHNKCINKALKQFEK